MLLRSTGKQSASISFNPFQYFGWIPWKPDAQWCNAAVMQPGSQVEAQQRKLLHCSSCSYVELWANSGKRAVQAGVCVLFSSSVNKREWGKNYIEFSCVFCPSCRDSMAADHSCLWLYKVGSRSVRNWSFFLCLNLWLIHQSNTEVTSLAKQSALWVSRRWELSFLRIRVCKTHKKLGSACLNLSAYLSILLAN